MGAFGAHTLRDRLEPKLLNAFEVGVRYHIIHAVVLLVLGVAFSLGGNRSPRELPRVAAVFCWGIILFSGSLYGLALTDAPFLGPITPIGGLILLGGWLWLFKLSIKGGFICG